MLGHSARTPSTLPSSGPWTTSLMPFAFKGRAHLASSAHVHRSDHVTHSDAHSDAHARDHHDHRGHHGHVGHARGRHHGRLARAQDVVLRGRLRRKHHDRTDHRGLDLGDPHGDHLGRGRDLRLCHTSHHGADLRHDHHHRHHHRHHHHHHHLHHRH